MPIQELMIPQLLAEPSDVVGLACTGTGKTAAFGLPLIHGIEIDNPSPQTLVLCPTRELCVQITGELESYGKYMRGLRVTSIYGGDGYERQIRELRTGTHIIAATPGRLLDLLERRRADISGIRTLVLDEADIMLKMGFKEELDAILESAPAERQTILLSATMPDAVARIAKAFMKDPVELSVGIKNTGPQTVEHTYCTMRQQDKYQALKRIVDFHPTIYGIIFCRTRAAAGEIAEKMVRDGYHAEALHGDLSQSQREHVMGKFRSASVKLLVATDIAARGLDVDNLTHVIHYDLPTEADIYTHRSGRTGRAGKIGTSLALISEKERGRLRWIERSIKRRFVETKVPGKQEIFERQLMQLVDLVTSVDVGGDEMSSYLSLAEEKLASLSRRELIQRFVSLDLNRYLQYYKDRKDLRPATKSDYRSDRKNDKRHFDDRRGKRGRRTDFKYADSSNGYDWIAVDIGKNGRVLPLDIIGLVNQGTRGVHIRLGRIDIGSSKSWIQVESGFSGIVEEALRGTVYNGRRLSVERVAISPGRAKKTA